MPVYQLHHLEAQVFAAFHMIRLFTGAQTSVFNIQHVFLHVLIKIVNLQYWFELRNFFFQARQGDLEISKYILYANNWSKSVTYQV